MKKLLNIMLGLVFATLVIAPTSVFADEPNIDPEYGEPVYTLTFDFNGGATYEGQGTLVKERLVSVAPVLNEQFLVSCIDYNKELDECHPLEIKKGKELSYVTVNGERHEYNQDDGFMFNQDTIIKYFWTDKELEDYTVEDKNGNVISFDEEDGHDYNLTVTSYSMSMTDEEVTKAGIDLADYKAGKAAVIGAVEEHGQVVLYLEIEVTDESRNAIHQGPFNIKIKFTDEMAGYDAYKIIYVEVDSEGNATTEEAIDLTLEDGYLVGTLPHLSGYAIVGVTNAPAAPDTGEFSGNANASASIFSIVGTVIFATLAFILKKF